jgi:hypothetical protein
MTEHYARRVVWTLIRIGVAASLLCFAAGALHETLPFRLREQMTALLRSARVIRTRQDVTLPPARHGSVTIEVWIGPQSLRGAYKMTVDAGDPLLPALHRAAAATADDAGPLLDRYLGMIGGNHGLLRPAMPHFQSAANAQTATIEGSFEQIQTTDLDRSFDVTIDSPTRFSAGNESIDITLHGSGVTLVPADRMPLAEWTDAKSHQSIVRYRWAALPDEPERVRVQAFVPPPQPTVKQNIGQAAAALTGGYVQSVSPLIYGCLSALPFVLFLFAFRGRLNERLPSLHVAISFAWLYLLLGLFAALIDAFWNSQHAFRETVHGYPSLQLDALGALTLAFAAVLWPLRVRRTLPADELLRRLAPPFTAGRIAACVIALATMALAIGAEIDLAATKTWALPWPWHAILAVALLAALVWLVLEIEERRSRIAAGALALGLMLVYLVVELQPLSRPFRIIFLWLLSLPFAFTAASMAPLSKRRRMLLFAIVAGAVLCVVWPAENNTLSDWWIATSLAAGLAELLPLLLLAVLVRHLGDLSRTDRWEILERDERDAGTALVLMLLVLFERNWLAVPIVLALGALLLRWLFATPTLTAPSSNGAATIKDLIRYNEACRALRQLKRELAKSVAGGSITFNEYQAKADALEAHVDELATRLGGVTAPRAAVLSSGLPTPPSQRALLAARYALLAALPWIAVFAYNTARDAAPEFRYQWLSVAAATIFGIAQWPLYGLFLGYFYPHIRGNSGVGKAISVFALLAIPTVVATMLTAPLDSAAWTSVSFWTLQLLVMLLITGLLAGDLETLHSSGLAWRHLLDVHDLGALAAYASTIVAAIGAAISTYLAAQVPAMLTGAMQYFTTQPPR